MGTLGASVSVAAAASRCTTKMLAGLLRTWWPGATGDGREAAISLWDCGPVSRRRFEEAAVDGREGVDYVGVELAARHLVELVSRLLDAHG